MSRVPALSLLLLSGAVELLGAAAPPPVAYTSLQPRSVTVGQPVTLIVDVFVPSYFTSAPRFPPIEVKDAVVVFLDTGGQNLTETVGTVGYTGQRRSYLIYPQRPGDFEVPSFDVKVRYAVDGASSPPTPAPARGWRFTASVPAAARSLQHFIATPAFELTAALDRPTEGLKVGDSLTRTITLKATEAFAMMLPPLSFPAMEGLRTYPATPNLSDTSGERGEARVGTRVETVTYVFQKEGPYSLPAVEVDWWDTTSRVVRHATLPALELSVAANADLSAEIPLPEDPSVKATPAAVWKARLAALRPFAVPAAVVILALALVVRRLHARWGAWRIRRARRLREQDESAAAYFERVRGAAGSAPADLLAATYRWLDRRRDVGGAARLDVFARASGDPELPRLADELVRSALANGSTSTPSTAQAFVEALTRVSRTSVEGETLPEGLEPLNPR